MTELLDTLVMGGVSFLTRTRHRIEADTAAALGHPDIERRVPKEPRPREGGDRGRHARNLLLRALIREGIVKGRLERYGPRTKCQGPTAWSIIVLRVS
jgi:hypothetical protein